MICWKMQFDDFATGGFVQCQLNTVADHRNRIDAYEARTGYTPTTNPILSGYPGHMARGDAITARRS